MFKKQKLIVTRRRREILLIDERKKENPLDDDREREGEKNLPSLSLSPSLLQGCQSYPYVKCISEKEFLSKYIDELQRRFFIFVTFLWQYFREIFDILSVEYRLITNDLIVEFN